MDRHYSPTQKVFIYIFYVILLVFFLLPVVYIFAMSLKTEAEVLDKVHLFNFYPKRPTLENFGRVIKNVRMDMYLANSAKLVITTSIGVLLAAFPSAFALSRGNFKRKELVMMGVLFFQMISPIIISISIYWYYSKLHLLNTYSGLALIYIAIHLPFTTFLMKGVFDAIPRDLDEAAHIDGCSRFATLLKVIIPTAVPGIASATIFNSINAWSQFIIPFFLISDNKLYPVSVGILQAQGSYQDVSTHYLAAASVIGLFPAVLLVLFLQKFIIRALTAGAVKG
ncbi:MAG: carbohydrate ABC transporter permease [Spirochaetales bacterium]|nr:carbohydrate ABC transporter permease [Spirochaetales bacterium]